RRKQRAERVAYLPGCGESTVDEFLAGEDHPYPGAAGHGQRVEARRRRDAEYGRRDHLPGGDQFVARVGVLAQVPDGGTVGGRGRAWASGRACHRPVAARADATSPARGETGTGLRLISIRARSTDGDADLGGLDQRGDRVAAADVHLDGRHDGAVLDRADDA